MRIKLAILHSDPAYVSRLTSVLGARYQNRLAIYSFSGPDAALEALAREKMDVFLAEDAFEIPKERLPDKCGFAYFVDSPEVDSVRGFPAVCRFQRTELLYKQILGLFSDALGETSVRNLYSGSTKTVAFSSPCGGTGTSTLAAACAMRYAAAGRRCLYLNLEDFGSAGAYFSGDGAADMSDVVYAVKSRRGSLAMKLESCVRQDPCGVYFFSAAKVALDMMELTGEERGELVSALSGSGRYDVVIVDMAFDLRKETRAVFDQAHVLVWVSDGLAVSDFKIARAYGALRLLDQSGQGDLAERVCLLQNKSLGGTPAPMPDLGVRSAGAVPKIRRRPDEPVAGRLAASDALDAILDV